MYRSEQLKERIIEWSEEENVEEVSWEEMGQRRNRNFPVGILDLEEYWPSARDAVVECGLTYRRGDWTTDLQLDCYPDTAENSTGKDVFAYYIENYDSIDSYIDIVDDMDVILPNVTKTLGPMFKDR